MKKPHIGMIKAMRQSAKYKKMSDAERAELRNERFEAMVSWARENSAYYKQKYAALPAKIDLSDLPPVSKGELMEHWDEWVCAPNVCLNDVREFMNELDNIGRKLKGEYLVFTTSGSTGNPLVMLCDNTTNNVMGAVNALRAYARSEDMKSFIKRGGKTIGVFATGGFYLGNSSVRTRLLKMPWKKRQMAVSSALYPIEQIVAELNDFQPAMLGGYPSNLELLIDEAKAGRLNISPMLIMTGGEYLSDSLRARLSEAFGCYVQTSYSCTEGGTLACECREQHLHINDDWVLLEAVDKDNNPVADGEQAEKVLLTNLFNFTQPFIRYEITDRVVVHKEPCACGNRSPWLTLEGRTDDVVSFTENSRTIRLAPLAIYATLKEVHELRRFQLLAYPENYAELRIEPVLGIDREAAFASASAALDGFFALHGLNNVAVKLSDELPKQNEQSGKFKHIIQK